MKLIDRYEFTDDLLAWLLVLVVLDGYEPQLAPLVLEAVAERDTETCGLVWGIAAQWAREQVGMN